MKIELKFIQRTREGFFNDFEGNYIQLIQRRATDFQQGPFFKRNILINLADIRHTTTFATLLRKSNTIFNLNSNFISLFLSSIFIFSFSFHAFSSVLLKTNCKILLKVLQIFCWVVVHFCEFQKLKANSIYVTHKMRHLMKL